MAGGALVRARESLERLAASVLKEDREPIPIVPVKLGGKVYTFASDRRVCVAISRRGDYKPHAFSRRASAVLKTRADVSYVGPVAALKKWAGSPRWRENPFGKGFEERALSHVCSAFGVTFERRLIARALESAPDGNVRVGVFPEGSESGITMRIGDEWRARVMGMRWVDEDSVPKFCPHTTPGWRRMKGRTP